MSGVMFVVCIPSQEKERVMLKCAGGIGAATPVSLQTRRKTKVRNDAVNSSISSDNDDNATSTSRSIPATRRQKLDRSLSENSLFVADSKTKQYLQVPGTKADDSESLVESTSGAGDQMILPMEQVCGKCTA